jgi:DNA-binding CsgD family transcriptional regulator
MATRALAVNVLARATILSVMGGAEATGTLLERGRDSFARRAWSKACELLTRADADEPLRGEDLELLATSAYLLGRDDDFISSYERAHYRYLEAGATRLAARAALWAGMHLAAQGEVGPASGWLGRAQRLLDKEPGESAERGYLLLPVMFRYEAAGDFEAAAAAAREAAAIGERFGDLGLLALATHGQGHMLIRAGRVREGIALLDEAMVTATGADVSPIIIGLVYCGVILACQEVYEVRRAREWTAELSRWCEQQPEMVAFTGRCLVHRAEILQLGGEWADALEEAQRATWRFVETRNPAAGLAHYRRAELLRLQGDFAAAEEAYRDASRAGWEPQPGLSQLRLAQGRSDAAIAAIRRACAEVAEPVKRLTLVPAYVEIMLAAGETDEARAACRELEELAAGYESPMLSGLVAYACGATELASGDARAALAALRRACRAWQELEAPYELARTRTLVGLACRALGDEEAAALELEAARTVFADLGAVTDVARVDALTSPAETHGLSRRELEVLSLVAAGKSNREIAAELVISEHTVARHLQNIFRKLRLSSRTAVAAFAFEHDLV